MLFKRKHEFKPDKPQGSGLLSNLYLTKKQRLNLVKWVLLAAVLVVLSVMQDVIMSRVSVYGATTDLVAVTILLICIMLDPEIGCVFTLISALLYKFSGSAPGAYVIVLLPALGLFMSIFRHSYLRASFGATFLCAAGAIMVYELIVFAIACFLGQTTFSRLSKFCLTGVYSLAVIPLLYPVISSISKIGGETWTE